MSGVSASALDRLEARIIEQLQEALSKAESGDWDISWALVEGLWSPFMARERCSWPPFPE